MADLRKEVWINQLLKNFYPDSSFLNYVKDFSPFVENNALNIADVGLDPEVLINNTAYPISVVKREDTPIRIELDVFETENTLVRHPEAIEYAYNQLESVLMGHRNMLRAATAIKAAHSYAPMGDATFTPVIRTSGEATNGRKRITIEDILQLKERFDSVDIPLEDRYLVLHPSHLTDLILLDTKSFKDLADVQNGVVKSLAGFGVLQTSKTAYYDNAGAKKSFGSVPVSTDGFCSFAFQSDEVMKADGVVKMYALENDPKERATIVGFEKRFVGLPFRNKGIGSIVSSIV